MIHVLYRFFNVEGELLYIGQSSTMIDRLHSHQSQTSWFAEVATITTEAISPGDARQIERQAIIDEQPRYNRQHSKGFGLPDTLLLGQPVFDYVAQLRACGLTYRQIAHRLQSESGRSASPFSLRTWFVAEAKRRSVEWRAA